MRYGLQLRLLTKLIYGQTFNELLALNTMHEELMGQAIFGKWTTSPLYGKLPTQHKRKMDRFQSDWRSFNLKMIQKANQVRSIT